MSTNPELEKYLLDGNAYKERGELDSAVNMFLSAIKLEPNHIKAHISLGDVYCQQKKFDLAEEEYLFVLKLVPQHEGAKNKLRINSGAKHFHQGLIYFNAGEMDKAEAEFTSALKFTPDNEQIANYINQIKQKISEKPKPQPIIQNEGPIVPTQTASKDINNLQSTIPDKEGNKQIKYPPKQVNNSEIINNIKNESEKKKLYTVIVLVTSISFIVGLLLHLGPAGAIIFSAIALLIALEVIKRR